MLVAQGIRATGFKRAQGIQHCAKSESHTNRVTFETNAIMMIVKVHPHSMLVTYAYIVHLRVIELIRVVNRLVMLKRLLTFENQ